MKIIDRKYKAALFIGTFWNLGSMLDVYAQNPCSDSKNTNKLPVIETQLGDTWEEARRNSTFTLSPPSNPAGTIINEPHTFVYRDPAHYMQLENVAYTAIGIRYETHRIFDFGIGPYRDSASANETWARLQILAAKMEKANWELDIQRDQRWSKFKSAEELKKFFATVPPGGTITLKAWYDNDGNEAWIRVVKINTGQEEKMESMFNIVLQIYVSTSIRTKNSRS